MKRIIVLVAIIALAAAPLVAQQAPAKDAQAGKAAPATKATKAAEPAPVVTPSGLKYWDLKVGTGAEAVKGKTVRVHYTGWLTNGKKFDSSLDRGEPFEFRIGAGQVIQGWEEGVAGMKVGGKRKLEIPPALAYGKESIAGLIPPNATLIFQIELLAVK